MNSSLRRSASRNCSSLARRPRSISRSPRSASTFSVVSLQAQNIPATRPVSSRTGEYENVNQVCSSYPFRFIRSGRSSR